MIEAAYINDLCTRSHAMAKEKGWWDETRSPYELGNLCHSELSEALEELRDGRGVNEIYYRDDKPTKPEGFPVELADFVIRLADWAASDDGVCDSGILKAVASERPKAAERDLQRAIHELHTAVVEATKDARTHWAGATQICAMGMAFQYAEIHGIDLPAVIELKMAYNATRPIRHGRKF